MRPHLSVPQVSSSLTFCSSFYLNISAVILLYTILLVLHLSRSLPHLNFIRSGCVWISEVWLYSLQLLRFLPSLCGMSHGQSTLARTTLDIWQNGLKYCKTWNLLCVSLWCTYLCWGLSNLTTYYTSLSHAADSLPLYSTWVWYSEFLLIHHNSFWKFGWINEFGGLSKSICSPFNLFMHKIDGR